VLLMDFSISLKRNVSAFRVTFFEMLSAWSPSFLADMTRISREMKHRACKERGQSCLLPMRLRLLPSHSFRHSKFTLANRITSGLPTNQDQCTLVWSEHCRARSDLGCRRATFV